MEKYHIRGKLSRGPGGPRESVDSCGVLQHSEGSLAGPNPSSSPTPCPTVTPETSLPHSEALDANEGY